MIQKVLTKTSFLLVLILLVAGFFRFYHLDSNAASLTWDEVAWGYNAYSLGFDGKDEFGRMLPLDYFESFGDFKPPVYAYLTILPVLIFGLTEFATRFPSALLGTLTVLITYFLVRRLFLSDVAKQHESYTVINSVALLSALLLAISPWHILLSRAAFEANVATFFLVTGVWLFLEAVYKRKWLLLLSAICFVLALYTFNSARIVAPLLLLGLAIGNWKKLWQIKSPMILAVIMGIMLILPTAKFLVSPEAQLRFKEVNIFSNIELVQTANQQIANDNNAIWSKLLHNRRVVYAKEYLSHYFDNLSFDFLFMHGDQNPKFSIQSMGQMYLWELPFLIAGLIFLIRKREGQWWLIPYWIFVGIIPAAFARETPHALRIEGTLPMFQLIVAYGLIHSFVLLKEKLVNKNSYRFVIGILILCILTGVIYFSEQYFIHHRVQYSREWQYGYKDAVMYMTQENKKYDKVYLTEELGRPYIYFLFYTKYNPQSFRSQSDIYRDQFGFVHVNKIDKYYFEKKKVDASTVEDVLYIDTPGAVPVNAIIKKGFFLVNGEKILVAYTLK